MSAYKHQYGYLEHGNVRKDVQMINSNTHTHNCNYDWNDIRWHFREKENEFRLYFSKVEDEHVIKTSEVCDNISAHLDNDGKILFLSFKNAFSILGCHLFKYPRKLDELSCLNMTWLVKNETLLISFTENMQDRAGCLQVNSDWEYDIILDVNSSRRILRIEIQSAFTILKNTIENNLI